MSRPTDTERGARIACQISLAHMQQEDLFQDVPSFEFWEQVYLAAHDQLVDSRALREAVNGC